MARLARVVAVDAAHHLTQGGKARPFLLATEAERRVYLDLRRQAVRVHALPGVGSCRMSSHVHRVVIRQREMALGRKPGTEADGRKCLQEGEAAADLHALRQCPHSGRPLGAEEFTARIEASTHRRLTPPKGGRPRKPVAGAHQQLTTRSY